MDLTETQQAILALISERIAADGVPPSQTEIAHAMGFKGVRAAQYHIEALEQAGVIRRVPLAASVDGRTQRDHAASMRPSSRAAIANENAIEKPT